MKTILGFVLALASPLAFAASRTPDFNIREIVWNILLLAAVALIFGVIDYAISKAPFIMEPVKAVVHWVLVAVLCVIIIFMIMGFFGL